MANPVVQSASAARVNPRRNPLLAPDAIPARRLHGHWLRGCLLARHDSNSLRPSKSAQPPRGAPPPARGWPRPGRVSETALIERSAGFLRKRVPRGLRTRESRPALKQVSVVESRTSIEMEYHSQGCNPIAELAPSRELVQR